METILNHPRSLKSDRGVKVERSIVIQRPIGELYQFWRNFENLPKIMSHVVAVTNITATQSLWIVESLAGMTFKWESEIIDEKVNEIISWRSLPNSEIQNAGSVRFQELPNDGGCLIKINLKYDPPGGKFSIAVAKMFLSDAASEIEQDLNYFKQFMESKT